MKERLLPFVDMTKMIGNVEGVSPLAILSIIYQESRGLQFAYRYEPKYNYLYLPMEYAKRLIITMDSEVTFQKTSFGLCQIMGAVARQFGGHDGFLSELFLPQINIQCAAKYMGRLFNKYPLLPEFFSSYNAGVPKRVTADSKFINQEYVDNCLQFHKELSTWGL